MPSLRHSCDGEPGYYRYSKGRGFVYKDFQGRMVSDDRVLKRIRELVIPPAWKEVWVCRSASGHLQATGIDAKGRKQYIYHPRWRAKREELKYRRILDFAEKLPTIRSVYDRHLRKRGLPKEKVLAAMVEILDRTSIRAGSESYAAENKTYGIATLRSKHLSVEGDHVVFRFTGKAGKPQHTEIVDKRLAQIIAELDHLPGYEIFKYRDKNGELVDVKSQDLNAYIKEFMGEEFTAKDFRTWAGTVAAAVALSELKEVTSQRARQRAVAGVVKTAARLLGNTPAVCRASYIDPRVIDHYLNGVTIAQVAGEVDQKLQNSENHTAHELAVLYLLKQGLVEQEKRVS